MEFELLNSRIADAAMEIILVFNQKGDILFLNKTAEEKLEYNREALKKCDMQHIFQNDFSNGQQDLQTFLDNCGEENREFTMYRSNNSCFSAFVRVIPADAEGAYILMAVDNTARRDINQRVRKLKEEEVEQGRMKNEFTANVTHELRTPVNGIKGQALELREEITDTKHQKSLDIILHCCNTMLALISDVLDFSKLENGKFTIEEAEFDFYDLMDKVVATHSAEINRKELRMSVTIDEHIPRLLIGDELRIGQILNNLLSNAIKFTTVGHVNVVVNKSMQINDEVELFFMVMDSGIGMSPKEQDRLFQSFSQVDASITRRFGGIGLGLVITKQLINMMNGDIHVESEKGKGSTFSFFIRLKTSNNPDDSQNRTYADWSNYLNDGNDTGNEGIMQFGEPENIKELKKRMNKLMLSIELEAWDKAELLATTIKALVENGDDDIKKLILKLEMGLRKCNHEKSIAAYNNLKDNLTERFGEI